MRGIGVVAKDEVRVCLFRIMETTNSEQPEARRSLHAVVIRHCAHIRKPYTLEEICEQVAGNEYNSATELDERERQAVAYALASAEMFEARRALEAATALTPCDNQKLLENIF